MRFYWVATSALLMLNLTISPLFAQDSDTPFTLDEKAILSRIDKVTTAHFNRITSDEALGSLKKPQVKLLSDDLNDITNQAYTKAKTGTLTDQDEMQLMGLLDKNNDKIVQWENENLAYCRKTNSCPEK